MAKHTMTQGSAPRRGSREWRHLQRRVCRTPTNMIVTAIVLRKIDGPEGRKLYGGAVPTRALRRTLALAARLEREAGVWEGERRLAKACAKGLAGVAA
jgi:hypothetical protein